LIRTDLGKVIEEVFDRRSMEVACGWHNTIRKGSAAKGTLNRQLTTESGLRRMEVKKERNTGMKGERSIRLRNGMLR